MPGFENVYEHKTGAGEFKQKTQSKQLSVEFSFPFKVSTDHDLIL